MPFVYCHKQLGMSFKVIFEDLQSLHTFSCGTCTFQKAFKVCNVGPSLLLLLSTAAVHDVQT